MMFVLFILVLYLCSVVKQLSANQIVITEALTSLNSNIQKLQQENFEMRAKLTQMPDVNPLSTEL